jgi:hypothetical protein
MASETFLGITTEAKVKTELQKMAKKENRSVSSYTTMLLKEIISIKKKKQN